MAYPLLNSSNVEMDMTKNSNPFPKTLVVIPQKKKVRSPNCVAPLFGDKNDGNGPRPPP